ncbi:LOW QUALITY PROTEIN: HAD-like domain-containing protein [Colletotrichum navitas]|uniref:HAD-like domain-containing protein n=1 Tax=Colletotrichum navitas TaxID=681940 RepID=A0AAD8PM65_9PEZI|nr:LOW QUALITY PROTEIN: HAD-like domain-containing protein [Colletotrichum navitas]KAK1570305.1 LOW QUALITY PROTEIN: HAD-like domain-containing protein [Colletotrichum navitas]
MESIQHRSGALLFDLDNTLFDHYYSLRSAISSIQASYDSLKAHNRQDLISKHNKSLQKAYDEKPQHEITYEEADFKKFFGEIGLPEPDHKQIVEFRNIYKSAYRNQRRATPNSVEMPIRLSRNGFRVAIVTNCQPKDQLEKAKAIGLDTKVFRLVIEVLGVSPQKSYMIDDSVNYDIKGGLDGLSRQMADVLEYISNENYVSAIARLEAMIKKS